MQSLQGAASVLRAETALLKPKLKSPLNSTGAVHFMLPVQQFNNVAEVGVCSSYSPGLFSIRESGERGFTGSF